MKNADELVTVAVPVYNSYNTLEKTVQSIMSQYYKNIEILLVNDGSTDDSKELCEGLSLRYSSVRTINMKHSGVSTTRNAAISVASGKYIAFVDSDDYIDNYFISSLVNMSKESFGYLTLCGIQLLDAENNSIIENRTYPIDKKPQPNSEFVELYKSGLLSSVCNKLYDVQILKDKDIKFNNKLSTGEDLLFNIRYLRESQGFAVDNSPLYIYNVSSGGTLHTKHDASRFNEIKMMANELTNAAKHFKCPNNAFQDISLKILDEYMHSIRLFCLSNPNTAKNRRFLSEVMKTDEFKNSFKTLNKSKESAAYKTLLRFKSPALLALYFSFRR